MASADSSFIESDSNLLNKNGNLDGNTGRVYSNKIFQGNPA